MGKETFDESQNANESKPKNKLVQLEGGMFFANYPISYGTERMKLKKQRERDVLINIYQHYAQEWRDKNGKTGKDDPLTDEEVEQYKAYISSIPPDQIIALLEEWQKELLGADENYKELSDEFKLWHDVNDELISEISTW